MCNAYCAYKNSLVLFSGPGDLSLICKIGHQTKLGLFWELCTAKAQGEKLLDKSLNRSLFSGSIFFSPLENALSFSSAFLLLHFHGVHNTSRKSNQFFFWKDHCTHTYSFWNCNSFAFKFLLVASLKIDHLTEWKNLRKKPKIVLEQLIFPKIILRHQIFFS